MESELQENEFKIVCYLSEMITNYNELIKQYNDIEIFKDKYTDLIISTAEKVDSIYKK